VRQFFLDAFKPEAQEKNALSIQEHLSTLSDMSFVGPTDNIPIQWDADDNIWQLLVAHGYFMSK